MLRRQMYRRTRGFCTGVGPTLNVPPADERPSPSECTNELLIVCSATKLMAGVDLINSDVAGY